MAASHTLAAAQHVPTGVTISPLLRLHNVALGVAWLLMALQLFGGAVGELAALSAVPLLAAAAFSADRRYLAVLLVLCIPAAGVLTLRGAGFLAFPRSVEWVVLGGIEVPAPLVVVTAGFARVCLELVRGGRAFRGVIPRPLLLLFLAGLFPAFLGALLGQAMGLNQWSLGFRAMLALGGLFWGVLVARGAGPRPGRMVRQLAGIVFVGAALMLAGFLRDMMVFIVIGLAGGLVPWCVQRRRLVEAAVLAGAAVVGIVGISLTTAGQVLVALGCLVLAAVRSAGLRRWILRAAVLAGCAASGAMIWLVTQLHDKTLVEFVQRDEGLVAYAMFKLLGDRGPLWLAAIQQISSGPYWIVPSGRPLRPENFNYGYIVYIWEYGSHNTFLELLRHTGFIAGPIGMVLIGYAVVLATRTLTETADAALRGLAAGFLGVAVVGVTTGNFPVHDVGFFLWALGGMIAVLRMELPRRGALAVEEDGEEADDAPPPRALAAGRW
jgi:hypothetical protein